MNSPIAAILRSRGRGSGVHKRGGFELPSPERVASLAAESYLLDGSDVTAIIQKPAWAGIAGGFMQRDRQGLSGGDPQPAGPTHGTQSV
jgi:hypothetical protein